MASHHTWIVVLLLWDYFLLLPSLTHIVLVMPMSHKIVQPQILCVALCNDLNPQKKTQIIHHIKTEALFSNISFQPAYFIACVLRCMCSIIYVISYILGTLLSAKNTATSEHSCPHGSSSLVGEVRKHWSNNHTNRYKLAAMSRWDVASGAYNSSTWLFGEDREGFFEEEIIHLRSAH